MNQRNHKIVAVTIVVIVTLAVIAWARGGRYHFDIRSILPFCSGQPVTLHDFGALALIGLTVWGACRLRRQSGDDEERGDEPPDDTTSASDAHANTPDDDGEDT